MLQFQCAFLIVKHTGIICHSEHLDAALNIRLICLSQQVLVCLDREVWTALLHFPWENSRGMLALSAACMVPGSPGFNFCCSDKWRIGLVRRLRWRRVCQGLGESHGGHCCVPCISAQTWSYSVLPAHPHGGTWEANDICSWAPGCPAGWRKEHGSAPDCLELTAWLEALGIVWSVQLKAKRDWDHS